ncbi:MAG: hypothetical protein K8S99_13595 [Planctomycetes bacterium]|nr:hypothetical protein [Planctomycetota bacterium]
MTQPTPDNPQDTAPGCADIPENQRLRAFADGELTGESAQQVRQRVAQDPASAMGVIHEQQLRQSIDRVMKAQTPATPESLRRKVLEAGRPIGASPAGTLARIGRWTPLGLAASLFIAALITFQASNRSEPNGVTPHAEVTPVRAIIPEETVNAFTRRHVACSRFIQRLHDDVKFPTDIREMPGAMKAYLGSQPYPTLDLSSLGYEFKAAGECSIPGEKSVHLIYQARPDTGRTDSMSLWVEGGDNLKGLEPDTPYLIGGDTAHPLLVWRHAGMSYYLTGDSPDSMQAAAQHLTTG